MEYSQGHQLTVDKRNPAGTVICSGERVCLLFVSSEDLLLSIGVDLSLEGFSLGDHLYVWINFIISVWSVRETRDCRV